MEILNNKERRKSFLLFLLMLIITFSILTLGMFFNNKLPWKENEILRKENRQIQYELKYQKRFIKELVTLKKAIDSLDKATEGYHFIEKSIISDISKLEERIPRDSLKNLALFDDIMLIYKKLINAKSMIKKMDNSKNKINKLNETIQDNENDIEQLERALDLCKQLNLN